MKVSGIQHRVGIDSMENNFSGVWTEASIFNEAHWMQTVLAHDVGSKTGTLYAVISRVLLATCQ